MSTLTIIFISGVLTWTTKKLLHAYKYRHRINLKKIKVVVRETKFLDDNTTGKYYD